MKHYDILRTLIEQLPDEQLPDNFNDRLMKKLSDEKIRRNKRNERITIAIISTVSAAMIAMVVFVFIYLEIKINLKIVPFYAFIGTLGLVLLIADYKLRKVFKKKHPDLLIEEF